MQAMFDFTKKTENDYKAWHGSNLYRKGSELLLGTYREEDVIPMDDTAEKFKTEFPLTGKFICVNKNVKINDSVLS